MPKRERDDDGSNYRTSFRTGAFGAVHVKVRARRGRKWIELDVSLCASAEKARAHAQRIIARDYWTNHA